MPLKTCLHLLSSSISNKFKIKVEMLPNKILLLELIKTMVPVNSFPHAVSYISDKIHIFLIPGKYCPWLVKTHTHTLLVGTVLISVECFMTCTYPEMKSGVTNSWNPKFSMQRCLPETCVYSIIWNKTALTGHPIWYFTPPPLLYPSPPLFLLQEDHLLCSLASQWVWLTDSPRKITVRVATGHIFPSGFPVRYT